MAFNPTLDGHKINMRSEYADTVTRKWTRAEVDNIMQQLVFDANSSSLASEAMTLDAVDAEWMGEMMVLDSAVITANMRTLNGKFTESISRTLTRKLSPDLSISGSEVGKVKKSGLYASIAAIFHVNDGQTATIIFHAPDGDPKVISPDDTLIAFRVLMNKTDITSHVLPQLISTKGVTSLDQVSTNIASLLKANSETFKGKQAQIANQKKELEAKKAELRKLEAAQVEAVQMEADAEKHMTDADEKGAGLESRIKRVEEDNTVLQEKIDKLKAKKAEVQPEPQSNAVSATPGKLDFVVSGLAKYGASLSPEGFIVSKTGTVTSVKPVVKGKRLRFEGKDGSLIASGATTEKFVSEFVERHWYWTSDIATDGYSKTKVAKAFNAISRRHGDTKVSAGTSGDGVAMTFYVNNDKSGLAVSLWMDDAEKAGYRMMRNGEKLTQSGGIMLDDLDARVSEDIARLSVGGEAQGVDAPTAPEVQQEPEAKYIDWFVNYTTSANTGRTTDVSRFDSMDEAIAFAKESPEKHGYILKVSTNGDYDTSGKTELATFFGSFAPSAQESLSMKSKGLSDSDISEKLKENAVNEPEPEAAPMPETTNEPEITEDPNPKSHNKDKLIANAKAAYPKGDKYGEFVESGVVISADEILKNDKPMIVTSFGRDNHRPFTGWVTVENGGDMIQIDDPSGGRHRINKDDYDKFKYIAEGVVIDYGKFKSMDDGTTPSPLGQQGETTPFIGAPDLASHYRWEGMSDQGAWDQYVKDTILSTIVRSDKVDRKEFLKYYNAIEGGYKSAMYPIVSPKSEIPKPETDPYASRIEALRTMPLKEYETAMDALIAELEDAGKLADYEAVLTEIDKARDEDLKKLVEGA